MQILRTLSEVLSELGGTARTSRLLTNGLPAPYSLQRVHNWRSMERFPDRETYPVILRELEARGFIPDPALWGLTARDFENAVDTARGIRQFFTGADAGGMTGVSGLVRVVSGAPHPAARGSRSRSTKRREISRRNLPAKDRQMQLQV